jgi:hypothetical protein
MINDVIHIYSDFCQQGSGLQLYQLGLRRITTASTAWKGTGVLTRVKVHAQWPRPHPHMKELLPPSYIDFPGIMSLLERLFWFCYQNILLKSLKHVSSSWNKFVPMSWQGQTVGYPWIQKKTKYSKSIKILTFKNACSLWPNTSNIIISDNQTTPFQRPRKV